MSGADASHTITLNGSVGVILVKRGFGMTAVGTPSATSAASVPKAATIQNRPSRVDRIAPMLRCRTAWAALRPIMLGADRVRSYGQHTDHRPMASDAGPGAASAALERPRFRAEAARLATEDWGRFRCRMERGARRSAADVGGVGPERRRAGAPAAGRNAGRSDVRKGVRV